ncbi:hypothetical protein [Floccifex porci]|uniref:Uncharacterized protein n=1 Tax=Floccifex porci TaxID=2606629 RepID=A0A7X2T3N4_9FIRM|nr:hypothetical protein [Floccifex porci]MSS01625.1 hypothetical protein [Floccifex porci]
MIIKSLITDNTYILPFNYCINIISFSEFKADIIDCLDSYFNNNKKNKAIIKDDEDEIILSKDFNFIYIPSSKNIDPNFEFKNKSLMNLEISKIIEENSEYFQSIDLIRNGFYDLLTDCGIYKLKRILEKDLDKHVEIEIDDFDISTLLQSFKINTDMFSETDKYIVLYNLLLYLNRNENNIVLIDFNIQEKELNWIKKIDKDHNFLLIDNESIFTDIADIKSMAFVRLSYHNFLEKINIQRDDFNRLSYIFHTFFEKNIQYQTEKNIELYRNFEDKNTTFLIKPIDTESEYLANIK